MNETEILKKRLGNNFRFLREINNYTQQEIADVLGLSVKQICRYENGEYVPSVISIYILSKLYDISMEWFITELF